MASAHQVKILDVYHVSPSFTSPESATELSLSLTFFDIMWLKMPQWQHLFFYKLTDSTPAFFNSVILPKLKSSLSHTLLHFLPLAGNIIWPPQATKPIILYTPNDGIQLTVAESNADLDHLSGNDICEAIESHHYLPELPVTDSKASVMAMQITLFPNQGFSIGTSSHHAVLDGRAYTMFTKAWSHICKLGDDEKQQYPDLLPELTPVFDRTGIQDPAGFEKRYLDRWLGLKLLGQDPSYPISLKLLPVMKPPSSSVRGVVQISREQINELRERFRIQFEKVPKEETNETKPVLHKSSFVLVYAYAVICIVKSKGLEKNRKVVFGFLVDCRARLDPPIHDNYFGNCLHSYAVDTEAEALLEENGFAYAVERLSEVIRSLEKGVHDGVEKTVAMYRAAGPGALLLGVAGSPRQDLYVTDFGWGRPKRAENTSIDQTGAIFMTNSQDGSDGIEISLVLEKHEMEKFMSLFTDGVKKSFI